MLIFIIYIYICYVIIIIIITLNSLKYYNVFYISGLFFDSGMSLVLFFIKWQYTNDIPLLVSYAVNLPVNFQ